MAVGFPTKVDYNTGDVLSAENMNDLSGTVNLLESAQYAAGKNKIINGDFGVWQRGTSFSNPATSAYTADRYILSYNGTGATRTISQQTFTPGTAPVAGYEGKFFLRYAQSVAGSGGTFQSISQFIEDVRTFAGQTVTLSYWAKASAGVTLSAPFLRQNFGSGGSANNDEFFASGATLTTSWQRFTQTVTLDSISGKTIGANSYLGVGIPLPINTTFEIDLWGVQLEAGSTASPFQTATGTKQGELAACQRYYQRLVPEGATSGYMGFADTTTVAIITIPFFQTMRVRPTALETSGTPSDYALRTYGSAITDLSAGPTFGSATVNYINITATVGSAILVVGGGCALRLKTATTSFLGWSAEL
jgi:hypothetical protein